MTLLTLSTTSFLELGVALTYQNIVIADNARVTGRLWTQTQVSFLSPSSILDHSAHFFISLQAAFAKGSIVYAPSYRSGVPDSTTPSGGPTYRVKTI